MNFKSILLVGFAAIALSACQKEINPSTSSTVKEDNDNTNSALDYYYCGTPKTVIQRTASGVDIGTVRITNNFTNIEVTYQVSGNWILDKTKIYIGPESGIPLNANGTPKTIDFPYKLTHPWDTELYTLRIPRGTMTGQIVIVAQADVLKVNKNTCAILETQCSFGLGTSFPFATGCTPQKIYYNLQNCTDN